MPYIGNVLTSFAVETGNINDQAVTAPKLSATGGTDGQVLALDSNLNLEWVSDPAGQWVTSGTNLTYTEGNVGIGTTSPGVLVDAAGANPTLRVRATTINTEVSTFRLTEDNSFVGAFVKYDGSTNLTHIGTHSAADSDTANDNNAITIIRDTRHIGLGTTSPSQKLHIFEATDGDVGIRIQNNDGFAELEVDTDELNYNADSHVFNNQADNAERMRIDTNGRLCLGTTSSTVLSTFALSSTNAYSSTGNISNDNVGLKLFNTNGTDGTGVNNYTGIQLNVGSGATSSGSLAYVRTADNQGAFVFNQRTGATTFAEAMRISNDGTVAVADNLTVNGVQYPDAGPLSNRNLIINGAMNVAQRGTTQTNVADSADEGYNTIDRFGILFAGGAGGVCTINQSTTTPTLTQGSFSHSYHVDVTTADTSIGASHYIAVYQFIEAQDIRNSGWDYTNTDSRLTLSFWARSSLAGTYCCHLRQEDVDNRYYTFEYTLAADTWLHVTHSVPGDTSAVFNDDANAGLRVGWMLAAGDSRDNATAEQWATSGANPATSNQVNFFNNTANDFFLTGVQLEVGDHATPFEHRTFGDDLDKCKRYFQRYTNTTGGAFSTGINGIFNSDTQCVHAFPFPKAMRASPSFAISQRSDFDLEPFDEEPDTTPSLFGTPSVDIAIIRCDSPTARTRGFASMLTVDQANGFFEFDAEL